jgi:hypothetical protein
MKTTCSSPPSKTSLDDLLELRRQLDDWRQAQPGRARLPDELWELAATLAQTHGVTRVARTLRLSFSKLRQRLAPPAMLSDRSSASPSAPAGFIELPPLAGPGLSGGGCVVELCDKRQGRMTLRFSAEGPALLALAEAFWRRGR